MRETAMEVGKSYFMRGARQYHVGRLVEITELEYILDNASWVADTGQFGPALKNHEFAEVAAIQGRVLIPRNVVQDIYPWKDCKEENDE